MSEAEDPILKKVDMLLTIAKECARILEDQPDCPMVVLRGSLPKKGWPRGKCLGSDSKGRFMAYDARKVLDKIMSMEFFTTKLCWDATQGEGL